MHPLVRSVFIAGDDDDVINKPFCQVCHQNARYGSETKLWRCPSCFTNLTPKKQGKGVKNKDKLQPAIGTTKGKKQDESDLPPGAKWIDPEETPASRTFYPSSNRTIDNL